MHRRYRIAKHLLCLIILAPLFGCVLTTPIYIGKQIPSAPITPAASGSQTKTVTPRPENTENPNSIKATVFASRPRLFREKLNPLAIVLFIPGAFLLGFGLLYFLAYCRVMRTEETVGMQLYTFRVGVIRGEQALVAAKMYRTVGIFFIALGSFAFFFGLLLLIIE